MRRLFPLLLTAAACATGPQSGQSTLVVAQGGDPGALNPAVTTSGNTHPVTDQMFNGLVGLDEHHNPVPELAEGFAGAAQLDALARFLAQPAAIVTETLEDLVGRGEVARDAVAGEYKLTDTGRREGARRFADEFAPLLSQGHGECNDPGCDCYRDPLAASECHRHRHGG